MTHLATYTVILIMTMLSMIPINVMAGNNSSSYTLKLHKQFNILPGQEIEDDNNTHRAPSRPITCSIHQDTGIEIPNIDTADINSFEIYDENQMCIATFIEEEDFITFIFSYTGNAEIHLSYNTYTLIGYISL